MLNKTNCIISPKLRFNYKNKLGMVSENFIIFLFSKVLTAKIYFSVLVFLKINFSNLKAGQDKNNIFICLKLW
jgi:hypothetical protein